MYEQDTIAAIATPVGEGAVAIVRVSGPDAERIASSVFVRAGDKNGRLVSHRLYHGRIQDPGSQKILDEVLLAVMRKPRSYTGEDIVELHCHGGAFVVRRVLELVLAQGARHAEPGEFTKRAFLNGRIDLTQAEAVLDIIRARTEKGVELAVSQAGGELSRWVHELRENLLDIVVQVEAAIDFPEEEIELLRHSELIRQIDSLRVKIEAIIATYDWGRLVRDGARVCICGRPNVGKSSLLNALAGRRSLARVSATPGKTSLLNVYRMPRGYLLDLPGYGYARRSQAERQAFQKLLRGVLTRRDSVTGVVWLLDIRHPPSPEDLEIQGILAERERPALVVLTKVDKLSRPERSRALAQRAGELGLEEAELLLTSSSRGLGIEDLRASITGALA